MRHVLMLSGLSVSMGLATFVGCDDGNAPPPVGHADEPPAIDDPTVPPNEIVGETSGSGRGEAPRAEESGSPGGQGDAGGQGRASGPGRTSRTRALPDLVMDGEYLRSTIREDFVDASADICLFQEGCVTGDGVRRVIRFATRTGNIGTADIVAGRPSLESPLWEFDACHEHFHFEGYAHHDLRDVRSGALLPVGVKQGFCLQDRGAWSSEHASADCARYDCDNQGIGVGCSDVYESDLACQWVDITDVPLGTYDLVVTLNTEQVIEELDYSNNSAAVRIEIRADSVRVLP